MLSKSISMGKYAIKNTASESKISKNMIIWAVIVILIIIGAIYYWQSQLQNPPVLGDTHAHADFKVYLNGYAINFSQQKYNSEEGRELSSFMHLHDGDGGIMHKHIGSGTLQLFFSSLNMSLDQNCFKLDNGTTYCNNENKTLKMFVRHQNSDWQSNSDFGNYNFQDLDRILISYGSESLDELKKQMDSVSDRACIPSEKCPERGAPKDENGSCSGTGPCVA